MTKYTAFNLFTETVGQHQARVKKDGYRKPLRTLRELADEFSVTPAKLTQLIRLHEGPEAVLRVRSTNKTQNSWYEPLEFRRWWRALSEKRSAAS
jgi:hypothetical protein